MSRREKSAKQLSRREFARRGAFAAAAAALPQDLIAQTADSEGAVHEPALSASSQAEADAMVASILRKYGNVLQDVDKLGIRRLVTEGMKPLEQLRRFTLENSDQPGNVLRMFPDIDIAKPLP